MTAFANLIRQFDWVEIARQLEAEGYAVLPRLLSAQQATRLASQAETPSPHRRMPLGAAGLGQGELVYFGANPPVPWADWLTAFYRYLAHIANQWEETSKTAYRFPAELDEFLQRNRAAGQMQAQSHLNRLRRGDYLALHQRSEGTHVFPLQIVALLSEPGKDFTGGELALVEQRPRMQSRPVVVPLRVGDAAIVATATRPFRGTKGYYRVNLRHAISQVGSGERIGVELSFHNRNTD